MLVLGIIFIVLQVLDWISTNAAIKSGCVEANPILKESLESGFPLYLIVVKMGLGIFLIMLLTLGNFILNWVVLLLDIFMIIVVINNVVRIPIQKKYNRIFFLESANMVKFMQVWDVREWRHAVQHVRPTKEPLRSDWVKNVSHVREWMANIQNSKEKEKK
jgi:hypothetical protein